MTDINVRFAALALLLLTACSKQVTNAPAGTQALPPPPPFSCGAAFETGTIAGAFCADFNGTVDSNIGVPSMQANTISRASFTSGVTTISGWKQDHSTVRTLTITFAGQPAANQSYAATGSTYNESWPGDKYSPAYTREWSLTGTLVVTAAAGGKLSFYVANAVLSADGVANNSATGRPTVDIIAADISVTGL